MLLLLLVGLVLCQTSSASLLEPTLVIEYNEPELSLIFKGDNKWIDNVWFLYSVDGEEHSTKAHPFDEGFGIIVDLENVKDPESISAYASYVDLVSNEQKETHAVKTKTIRSVGVLPAKLVKRSVAFRDDFNSFNKKNWITQVTMSGFGDQFQTFTNWNKNVAVSGGNLLITPTLATDHPYFNNEKDLFSKTFDLKKVFGACTDTQNNGCWRKGSKNFMLPPTMSGRVDSTHYAQYGTITIRARLAAADWTHLALWMMPKTPPKYGYWPKSGEIDIMESRGNDGKYQRGRYGCNLHWGLSSKDKREKVQYVQSPHDDWGRDYVNYRVEWTHDSITYYHDQTKIITHKPATNFYHYNEASHKFNGPNIWAKGSNKKMAPFDQPFFLIMNVAVGSRGNYWGDQIPHKPWKNGKSLAETYKSFWNNRASWQNSWRRANSKSSMKIDYVEFLHL